jgi:hypothetical protein
MRRITEQAVVTLDGQVSTPQEWLPPGGQASSSSSPGTCFSPSTRSVRADQLRKPRRGLAHLEEAFGDAGRMNAIPSTWRRAPLPR